MKGKNVNTNMIIAIAVGVLTAVLVVILCCNFFGGDKENKKQKEKSTTAYVIDPTKVTITGGNTDKVTNENCKSSSVKKKYSLTLVNGAIQVNNLDTMENFLIEKMNNVSTMVEFNYEKTCDTAMYAVLTGDGQVFYTYDDVTKTTNVKRIEDKFMLLKTDLRFNELVLGEEEGAIDLYGKTSTGNLYKIDLR